MDKKEENHNPLLKEIVLEDYEPNREELQEIAKEAVFEDASKRKIKDVK